MVVKKSKNFNKSKSKTSNKSKKYFDKIQKYKKAIKDGKLDKSIGEMKIDIVQQKLVSKVSKTLFNNKNTLQKIEEQLNKIGNVNILPCGFKSNGKSAFRVVFGSNEYTKYQSYTRKDIYAKGKLLGKILKKNGIEGEVSVSLDFNGKVRSGEFTKLGEMINIFDPNILSPNENDEEIIKEYKSINNFKSIVFFVLPENKKRKFGGKSYNNNCLFYCLNKAIPQYIPWKSDAELKKFLNVGLTEMISIDEIPKIEKKIKKVGINVSGDYNYTSTLGLNMNIHLKLENNHYTINHQINRKVNYISLKEHQIILIDRNNDFKKIGYDGKNIINISDEFYDDILNFRTKYIYVKYNSTVKRDENNKIIKDNNGKSVKMTIQEEYDYYIKIADELKNKTNGEINLYKTGSILKTAQNLLDSTTKHITPENILLDEAQIIQGSTKGATIFYDKYKGKGYKSDIKSMFPYIMSSQIMIPIKRGIFKKMTKEEFEEMRHKLNGRVAYGIYKIKIYPSEDEKINRWFRFNESNEYTSIDINHASLLNLKMELNTDEDLNVLLYPASHCIKADKVFKPYVDYLYKLKNEKIPSAKLLLNIISGAIGELNKKTIQANCNEWEFIDLDEMDLIPLSFSHSKDMKTTKAHCVSKSKFFKSDFARFKPFLWAQARFMMTKYLLPINNKVVKCITDGVITTEPIECFDEMGKFKYEGFCEEVEIINNSPAKGVFKL